MARRPLRAVARLDRPREKMLSKGPGALSAAELIAVILGTGTAKRDVLFVADSVIRRHPGGSILNATVDTLMEIPGIGKAKATQILAMCEYARRLFEVENQIRVVNSTDDVLNELKDLRNLRQEHFVVLALSARRHLVVRQTVAIGSSNIQIIEPREILFPALQSNAIAIILAHNHPSGDPSPSQDDIDLTNRMTSAGELMGVHILDHVVLAKNDYYSFREAGRI